MKLHFMKYRKLSYWISGILLVVSVVALFTRGLNDGIDFAGGISMEVNQFKQNILLIKCVMIWRHTVRNCRR